MELCARGEVGINEAPKEQEKHAKTQIVVIAHKYWFEINCFGYCSTVYEGVSNTWRPWLRCSVVDFA